MNPAAPEVLMLAIGQIAKWAGTFGITVADPRALAEQYRATLADIPGELLAIAVERVRANWHWHNLPLPGDIRAQVVEEMAEQRRQLARHEFALRMLRDHGPLAYAPPTGDEQHRRAAIVSANERWMAGSASPDDMKLLNDMRARNGADPLPSKPDGLMSASVKRSKRAA